MQRASATADAATGNELPDSRSRTLHLARRGDARPGVPGGRQSLRDARHGGPGRLRSSDGTTLTSQDYSSPRGTNGYYVFHGQWSPDSQYFVFSLSSSGGHSPWSFPIKVYAVKKNLIANFSDMIGGNPTVSGQFQFSGPHTLAASTWKKPGATEDAVPVNVDLEAAFEKLASAK